MQITRTSKKHQHKRIKTYRDNSNSYSFFNLLTSKALLNKVEALLPVHRERPPFSGQPPSG